VQPPDKLTPPKSEIGARIDNPAVAVHKAPKITVINIELP
jgi:hypothetical protein